MGNSRKIKILYLCPNGYLGGAERFVIDAARGHLISDKVIAEILFFNNGPAVKMAKDNGIRSHVLSNKFQLKKFFKLMKAAFEIRQIIKNEKFDIIHSTMPYSHVVNVVSTLFLPIKRVWFQHGPVGGFLDKMASLLPCDYLFFNSDFIRTNHYESIPYVGNTKSKIIHLGINKKNPDTDYVKKIRSNLIGDAKYLFLSMGRITDWKGYDISIKAIKHLLSKKSSLRIKFIIVGGAMREQDKVYLEYLKQLVIDLKLEKIVNFLGPSSDVDELYEASDLFIHSSKIPEPFGLVVGEAMAHKLLVVGPNRGGITDILINETTGYSYESNAEDAHLILADRIEKIIGEFDVNASSLNKIRENAFMNITENYSVSKMIKELEDAYLSI